MKQKYQTLEENTPILPGPGTCSLTPEAIRTAIAVTMGGFLFGYDIGVMSGALVKLAEDTAGDSAWGLDDNPFSNRGNHGNLAMVTMMATEWRGPVNVANQLMITVGILEPIRTRYLGHVTRYQPIRNQCFLIRSVPGNMRDNAKGQDLTDISHISHSHTVSYGNHGNPTLSPSWRYMLGLSSVPAILMVILVWSTSESVRWLAHSGKLGEAKTVLRKLRDEDVELEWEMILDDVGNCSQDAGSCFQAPYQLSSLIQTVDKIR
eukprot:sb/3468375/